MINIQFETAIVADGTYIFPALHSARGYVVELSGTFGGGTVTLGYLEPEGSFISYKDGIGGSPITATAEESWELTTPSTGRLVLVVVGATDPRLKLYTTLKQ